MTIPAATVKKPATHLAVSYVVCIAAATLIVAAIQSLTHNALSVVEGGALTTVLAEAAVMALRATGQVDIPDAPALTAQDVQAVVTTAVSAALAPKQAAQAPTETAPAAEAAPAS